MITGLDLRGIVAALALWAGPGVAQQQPAPDTLSETYTDWQVVCQSTDAGTRACEMSQQLFQQEGGRRVLRVAVQKGETADRAGLVLITPFGLSLPEGVVVRSGGETLLEAGFTTCLPVGCIARAPVPAAALQEFKAGEMLEIAMTTMGGSPLLLSVSLAGFTAAWTRLNDL